MASFDDNQGRSWTLALNVGNAKAIKTKFGVDLLDVEGGNLIKLADPYLLVEVLWELVDKPAGAAAEDFGAALAGDAVENATDALLEAITDFFPKRRREMLKKAVEKSRELDAAMVDQAAARINNLTPGDLSGEPPASSA